MKLHGIIIRHLLAAALAGFCSSAAAGEVVSDKLASKALGATLPFTVYLPDGYYDSFDKFPVVYLLHGSGGDEKSWLDYVGVRETLDGLIRRRHIAPMVAIMPGGGASWWIDGSAQKMQTALIDELMPYVEKQYEIKTGRANRAIAGISMGGFGALHLSLTRPDLVCAAGLLSPAIQPLPGLESSARADKGQFADDNGFNPDLWKAQRYPAQLFNYRLKNQIVPMYITSGDHDKQVTPAMTSELYMALQEVQPEKVELRIVDGAHEWMTFRDALPRALRYIDRQCAFRMP